MERTVNRQKFSAIVGIFILIFHVGMSAFLWFWFSPNNDPAIYIEAISLPLTAGYSVAVVKWFSETGGLITSDEQFGITYVFVITLIVGIFLICLPLGPLLYLKSPEMTPEKLNQFFLFVETSLGALFSIVFADMFKTD